MCQPFPKSATGTLLFFAGLCNMQEMLLLQNSTYKTQ